MLLSNWLRRLNRQLTATTPRRSRRHLSRARRTAIVLESLEDRALLTPMIDVNKAFTISNDIDNDGEADPGETVTYTIDIDNTGTMDATNVVLTDVVDPDTTLVGGSLTVTPIAFDDDYDVVGNTSLTITDPFDGLLSNDFDPDDPGALPGDLTVQAGSVTRVGGSLTGTLNVNSNGTFTYQPPVGLTGGNEIFQYTVLDDGSPKLASVTPGFVEFTISDLVWYVDNTSGGGGDGTLNNPFDTFTPLNGGGGSGDVDAAGEFIFVFEGDGTSTGLSGIELENNQTLIGEGVDLVVGGQTIITGNAANRPLLGGTNNGIDLASGNTIRGLDIGSTGDFGIAGSTVGNQTINNVSITGTGGLVNIDGGNLAITFDSLSTTSATGEGIDLNNVTGSFEVTGSTSISGASFGIDITGSPGATFTFDDVTTSSSGTGINIASSAGASFTFDGLDVTTSAGDGLVASGGGTIDNLGTATIDATGGAAIDINGTAGATNGTAGFTFSGITSTNSPTDGVLVRNINNGISITDLIVQNGTLDGAEFDTITGDITITDGRIDGDATDNHGILLRNINGTTTIQGSSAGSRFEIEDIGTAVGGDHDGIFMINSGDLDVRFLDIDDIGQQGNEHGIEVIEPMSPGAGNTRSIRIRDSIFANIGVPAGVGVGAANGIDIDTGNTTNAFSFAGTLDIDITGNDINGNGTNHDSTDVGVNLELDNINRDSNLDITISNNDIDGTRSGLFVQVEGDWGGNAASPGTGSGSRNTITIDSNILDDLDNDGIEINTTDGLNAGGTTRADSHSVTRAVISNNNLTAISSAGSPYVGADPDDAIEVEMRGVSPTSIVSVDIVMNTIDGTANTAGSRWDGHGILVGTAGLTTFAGTLSADIENNNIQHVEDEGIELFADEGGTVNARVLGNTIVVDDDGVEIEFEGNDPSTINVLFQNNDVRSLGGSEAFDIESRGGMGPVLNIECNAACPLVSGATSGIANLVTVLNHNGNTTNTLALTAADISNPGGGTYNITNAGSTPGANLLADIAAPPQTVVEETQTPDAEPVPANDAANPEGPAELPVVEQPSGSGIDFDLTADELAAVVDAATTRWVATGLNDAQVAALESASITVADLSDRALGIADGYNITLDVDAAGWGWFVDTTPLDDSEFGSPLSTTRLSANDDSAAAGGMDLLTTVMHEMGHVLGLLDENPFFSPDDLMAGILTTGQRRLPAVGQAEDAIPGSVAGVAFIGSPLDIGILPAGKEVQVKFDVTVDNAQNGFVPEVTNTAVVSLDGQADESSNTTSFFVDSLVLLGTVFEDVDNSGGLNAGDVTKDNVLVRLFADDGDGVLDAGDVLLSTTVTLLGDYAFGGLLPGDYIVQVDATEFQAGGNLPGFVSVNGAADPDDDIDDDDNGVDEANPAANGVASQAITLDYDTETADDGTGELDLNDTLDFGFTSIIEVTLSVSPATGTEAAGTSITVTANATSPVGTDQTVDLAVTGTGITAGDYTLSNTTITIPAGSSSGSVTFDVVDDAIVEAATETATLTISNPSAGIVLGSTTSQDVDITDNDTAVITIDDMTAAELDGTLTFTVAIDKAVDIPVPVTVSYTDGTATGSSGGVLADYDNDSDAVMFGALDTASKTVDVALTLDGLNESLENFFAALSSTVNNRSLNLSDTATGFIENSFALFFDIGRPNTPVAPGYQQVTHLSTYTIANGFGFTSGDVGGVDRFPGGDPLLRDAVITRNATHTQFSADVPNGDYEVTIRSGDGYAKDRAGVIIEGTQVDQFSTAVNQAFVATYNVSVSDGRLDLRMEQQGNTKVVLNALEIIRKAADGATVQFSVEDTGVSEGVGTFNIQAELSRPLATNLVVPLNLGGSATFGATADYTMPTSITILAGQLTGSVTVTVVDDMDPEQPETIIVTMLDPGVSGVSVGQRSVHTATITDDDGLFVQYDFGRNPAKTAPGYIGVTPADTYNATDGYGFTFGDIRGIDRTGTDPLHDAVFPKTGFVLIFGVDLPNGTYDATVGIGDAYAKNGIGVTLEGTLVDTVSTGPGEIKENTYRVMVSDGRLELQIDQTLNTIATVNYLSIRGVN